MKLSPQFRTPQLVHRSLGKGGSAFRTGFTLIELLVVIAIIGLLAALIVGLAGKANSLKAQSRVTTERSALETAIERYKKAKGFYPPDNPNDPACAITPLFYELTGTTLSVSGNTTNFISTVSGDTNTPTTIMGLFGTAGFINSSADPSSPAQNFFGGGLRTSQYLTVNVNGTNVTLLGIPVNGPANGTYYIAPGFKSPIGSINVWHYNYSHPTNNQGSYDLWIDVNYGGHTNRISNWSKDPQPL